jgi:hypothetical protein
LPVIIRCKTQLTPHLNFEGRKSRSDESNRRPARNYPPTKIIKIFRPNSIPGILRREHTQTPARNKQLKNQQQPTKPEPKLGKKKTREGNL